MENILVHGMVRKLLLSKTLLIITCMKLSLEKLNIIMSFYLWFLDVAKLVILQTKKTSLAIVDSFSETNEKLYFFKDSNIPLITSEKPLVDIDDTVWIFSNNKFTLNNNIKEYKHLPYISISLYKGTELISDISEWVQNIKVNEYPPLSHIIMVWAYTTKVTLDYKLSDYNLSVITEDGDEQNLKVA